ncbi:MAG: type II toxin-antitoxin system HicB family antitoxin [Candidatus Eremiobacteraeota bacterium]|nr:type II toxin-antitoxin system HicB family antitoxin [Candidatus Eremiobacteraeota bacterium]MBV8433783.1 type II toxin-antitoxin system HicB family antitoxin [Candidatus Eremiobacteraeota bacterium]MBV8583649.1 type II toxin-antitoxin system HicB family antitoxin [Candidatus Eremiobacteraeota bacterium]
MKTIDAVIEYDPETKMYGVTSPDLEDVYAVSDSRDDVLARFTYSANEYLAYLQEQRKPLPSLSTRVEVVQVPISSV